jgi:hypothetical protein
MNLKHCGLAAALAFAFATAAQAQGTNPGGGISSPGTPRTGQSAPMGGNAAARDQHKAEKEKIEADYKADKAKCDPMKGNAKDVCMKEAKGKEKVAKAELDAKDDKSGNGQAKVAKAKAEADYDVAKERCDDQKGKEKSACVKEAKAKRDHALAEAKGEKKAERSATRGSSRPADGSVKSGS